MKKSFFLILGIVQYLLIYSQNQISFKNIIKDYNYSIDSFFVGASLNHFQLNSKAENLFLNEKLLQIHSVVYDKPYDIVPKDWVEAFFKKDSEPQKTDRFWCSALVGFIYTQAGILDSNTDWSILTPNDFSLDGENLKFHGISRLANIEYKIM